MTLLNKLLELSTHIGSTPMRRFCLDDVQCYAKLEYNNFSGSIKDRAVYNILYQGIQTGKINEHTTLVESSSGNFAVSIASICNFIGLKFIGVIDPNINKSYEELLQLMAHKVIKVSERDETGGYLLKRIRTVKKLCSDHSNYVWTDQYENPDNFQAYFSMAEEIRLQVEQLDYAFIAVSTCGTITGLSRKLKQIYPGIRIVGVDIEGSLIFQDEPKRRYISGLGSSQRPAVLKHAKIDDSLIVSHQEIIDGCWDLMKTQSLFAGASTGAMYHAVNNFIKRKEFLPDSKVMFLCCDKGTAYLDTIYKKDWMEKIQYKDIVTSA